MILGILSEVYSRKQEGKKMKESHVLHNVIRASQIFQTPTSNLTILCARKVT